MSLSQSHTPKGKAPWENISTKPSSPRPRKLWRPDSYPDEPSLNSPSKQGGEVYSRSHGNAKPQEPPFLSKLPANRPVRMTMHSHADRPWTVACAPGKRENEKMLNDQRQLLGSAHHRIWTIDQQPQGRWNRNLKKAFYEQQDNDMMSKKCHDEKFAVGTNRKYWTHLQGHGTQMGGFEHKDGKTALVPPRATGLHLKSGLYKGKFDNVRHHQVINISQDPGDIYPLRVKAYQTDNRRAFDNRLHDDAIRAETEHDLKECVIAYDLSRPKNTLSCPQLGAEFCNR